MQRPGSQGFTALELVLVVALLIAVAGLSAVAIDVYRVRAQVSHCLDAILPAREVLEQFYLETGRVPLANEELQRYGLSLPDTPDYLSVLRLEGGRIELVFGNQASPRLAGHTLHLSPYVSADSEVIWHCGNAPLPAGLTSLAIPAGPMSQAIVPRQFLPPACRG